jgi:hypothetical protein
MPDPYKNNLLLTKTIGVEIITAKNIYSLRFIITAKNGCMYN